MFPVTNMNIHIRVLSVTGNSPSSVISVKVHNVVLSAMHRPGGPFLDIDSYCENFG
jgi:hypothetical protein